MTQEQIERYNKQKGKTRAKKLMPTSPVDSLIDSRQKAKEQEYEIITREQLDKALEKILNNYLDRLDKK